MQMGYQQELTIQEYQEKVDFKCRAIATALGIAATDMKLELIN